MELNKVITGDCAIVLQTFDSDSIDLTVTSPPYDNLRTYNGYTFDFETIAQQLFRVTKPGGIVVWIVGDATIDGSETGTSFRQAIYFMECGFRLHDTMIWNKCGTRYPDKKRYSSVFEYMFIFSKGKPTTVNLISDKINIWAGEKVARKNQVRLSNGKMYPNSAYKNNRDKIIKEVGVRFNIWDIKPDSIKYFGDHPAIFPEEIARDHILSWSNEGDTVLDCFAGSGTTLKMAKLLNRNFTGIEISPEYVNLIERRLLNTAHQTSFLEYSPDIQIK